MLGTIASGGSATAKGLFGEKPIVPGAPDYMAALRKTISGDISLVPSVTELASQSTALYKRLLDEATGGNYSKSQDLGWQQINAGLRGELPQDVRDQISRFSAEKAAGGGYQGSGAQANLTARDLGLNSLQLIQQSLGSAERWAQAAQSRTFDFSKMFFGPQEAIQQADSTWNRDWLAAQVAAAPDPQMRGAMDVEAAFGMAVMGMFSGGGGRGNIPQGSSQTNANYGGGRGGYMGGSQGYQGNMGGGSDFQGYFDEYGGGGVPANQPANQGYDYPSDMAGIGGMA